MPTVLIDAEHFIAEQERFLIEDARDVSYLNSLVGTEDLVQRFAESIRAVTSFDLVGARCGDVRFTKLARQVRNLVHEYKVVLVRRCGWTG